jgi:modulator of FtsH protease
VTAFDPEQWSDLFVASAGATAALAGLVFVAVSINVERILQFRGLPERGLATVLLLLGALVNSILGLVPGQSASTLGIELLVTGLGLSAAVAWLISRSHGGEQRDGGSHVLSASLTAAPGAVPYVIGAISLIAGSGGGLYWVLAGIVGGLIGGVLNAWVLLVEILR